MAQTRNRLSRMDSLRLGASLPFRAARLIPKSRALLLWSGLPLIITVSLYTWALSSLKAEAKAMWLRYFLTWGWDPQGLAADIVLLISSVFVFLVGALTFSVAAGVIASPLNDFLAETAESRIDPPLPPVAPQPFGTRLKLIWIDIVKTLAATTASVFALLLSWVPIVNLFVFAVAFLLMTFQYTSYAQTRRGMGLGSGLRFLWRHFYACLGFGAAISFLYALPLISIVALPLAVVGGTWLVARARPGTGLPDLR